MLLEEMLDDLGHEVPCVCRDIESALDKIQAHSFDGVFLDFNLHGTRADPIAAILRKKGVPFVTTTGGMEDPDSLGAIAMVPKPYRFDDIEQATRLFKS